MVYKRLPAQIAVHWDLAGIPDGWMSRVMVAFVAPATIAITSLVFHAAPSTEARDGHEQFTGTYDLAVAAVLLLVFVVHLILIGLGLGYSIPVARAAGALVGILFIVVGNVMRRARSNFAFGIRTPWALSNERVWARTHSLAGHTMTAAGLVMLLSAGLLAPDLQGVVIVAAMAAALVAPALYSYLTFRRESDR